MAQAPCTARSLALLAFAPIWTALIADAAPAQTPEVITENVGLLTGSGFYGAPGQSLTTPGGVPSWSSVTFHYYDRYAGTPFAQGRVYLTSVPYTGTPQNVFRAYGLLGIGTANAAGDRYVFPAAMSLQPNTQYYIYSNNQPGGGGGTTVVAGDPYPGGTYLNSPNGTGNFFASIQNDCAFRLFGVPAPGYGCTTALRVIDGTNGPFNFTPSLPSLWFVYTATCCGDLVFSTNGNGTFATDMEVYAGSCGSLLQLDVSSRFLGWHFAQIQVPAAIGRTYYIRVTGAGSGQAPLTVNCTPAPLANDHCSGAVGVSLGLNPPAVSPYRGFSWFETGCATTSAPAWPCAPGANDVWYVFSANCSAPHTFSTCQADYDTAIEVFVELQIPFIPRCASIVSLGCNDDATTGPCAGTLQSSLTVPLQSGGRYLVRVGGFAGRTGLGRLNIEIGTGQGSLQLSHQSTCDRGLSLNVSGAPVINGGLGMSVSGASGVAFCGIGFPQVNQSLVPACGAGCVVIGPSPGFGNFTFGTARFISIPCDGIFIGTRLDLQAFELSPAGTPGCFAGAALNFTDIYSAVIG